MDKQEDGSGNVRLNERLGALSRLLDELEAEMPYTRRASYWVPVIKAARHDYEQVALLQPYIHHHRKCFKGGNDNSTVIDCTCGLDDILSA